MDRRTFLGASSAPLLAGCSDLSDEEDETSETETERVPEEPEIEGDAEIVTSNEEWLDEGSAVEFFVANDGSTPSGPLAAVVRWYGEDGHYLGSDSVGVHSLLEGSSWHVAVESNVPFRPESFEVTTKYQPGRLTGRDDLILHEYEVVEESAIVGLIENTGDGSAAAEVLAAAYNSGWLSHTGTVSQTEIPSGDTWRFRLPLTNVDWEDSSFGDEIDVVLAASG